MDAAARRSGRSCVLALSRQWFGLACKQAKQNLDLVSCTWVELRWRGTSLSVQALCAEETAVGGFELVQSAKLSVKADCGLRFCLTQLFLHCWLSQFNIELNWFKPPHKPSALVYLCLLGRDDVQQQLRES